VYVFEPLPAALRLLEQNLLGLHNVTLYKVAAANKNGMSEFSVNKSGNTSSLGHNPAARTYIQVQTVRLDDVLREADRIDVLKIDVEGHEYEVLQGAVDLLRRHQPLLYFELLDQYVDRLDLSVAQYRSLLTPLGYTLAWINPAFPSSKLIAAAPGEYVLGIPHSGRFSALAAA
jgi:FkbM family methyltransferase